QVNESLMQETNSNNAELHTSTSHTQALICIGENASACTRRLWFVTQLQRSRTRRKFSLNLSGAGEV
ncbi:hypothetical protein ABTN03_18925, partial [Acinetobacter baumannii]